MPHSSMAALGATILVIDDDPDIQFVLQVMLEEAGFRVVQAATAEAGMLKSLEHDVDLALVDLRLPGLSGLEVIPSLRATSPMPIIVITAHGEGTDVLDGLRGGADDYITKPFRSWDLVSRITTQLGGHPKRDEVAAGFRLGKKPAKAPEQPLTLSHTEGSVLAHLVAADGMPVSNTELLRDAWGYRRPGDNRVVASMVSRLRVKLGDDAVDPQVIVEAPDSGYRICLPAPAGRLSTMNVGQV